MLTDSEAVALLREIAAKARSREALQRAGIAVEVEQDGSWTLILRRTEWDGGNGQAN